MLKYRPEDALGLQRVVRPGGVLPQQAEALDPSLPIASDELLIEVESLGVDSASFRQLSESCGGDEVAIEKRVLELVEIRGKLHNPVTDSGGMLIGKVAEIGPGYPFKEKPVKIGDRIATLVSLGSTPLHLRRIRKLHMKSERLDVEGHAILFATGCFARLPEDLPETVALAVLEVAGAPAQTRKLVLQGQVVVVIGGGKAGILCLAEAKRQGAAKTVAIDCTQEAVQRLSSMSFVDEVIQADARNAVEVMDKVWATTKGRMGDVVISAANVAGTEMAGVLSCRPRGIVYFFSLATSFTRAALGAEAVGADLDLRIGNGYTEGHAELALGLVRENPDVRRLFLEQYS